MPMSALSRLRELLKGEDIRVLSREDAFCAATTAKKLFIFREPQPYGSSMVMYSTRNSHQSHIIIIASRDRSEINETAY